MNSWFLRFCGWKHQKPHQTPQLVQFLLTSFPYHFWECSLLWTFGSCDAVVSWKHRKLIQFELLETSYLVQFRSTFFPYHFYISGSVRQVQSHVGPRSRAFGKSLIPSSWWLWSSSTATSWCAKPCCREPWFVMVSGDSNQQSWREWFIVVVDVACSLWTLLVGMVSVHERMQPLSNYTKGWLGQDWMYSWIVLASLPSHDVEFNVGLIVFQISLDVCGHDRPQWTTSPAKRTFGWKTVSFSCQPFRSGLVRTFLPGGHHAMRLHPAIVRNPCDLVCGKDGAKWWEWNRVCHKIILTVSDLVIYLHMYIVQMYIVCISIIFYRSINRSIDRSIDGRADGWMDG